MARINLGQVEGGHTNSGLSSLAATRLTPRLPNQPWNPYWLGF